MAKKRSERNESKSSGLKTQTKHGIIAVVFFVLAVFFLMTYFDVAGIAGIFVYEKLYLLLGIGYILLPTLLILLGSSFIKSEVPDIGWTRVVSGILFLLSGLGMIDIASGNHSGGFFGEILSTPFVSLFDVYASLVFLGAILIISVLIMFDAKLSFGSLFTRIKALFTKKSLEAARDDSAESEEEKVEEEDEEEKETTKEKIKNALGVGKKQSLEAARDDSAESEEFELPKLKAKSYKLNTNYVPPPLSLLEEDKGKPNTGDIKANANIIKRTLANFGIEVEMDEIT